MDEKVVEIRDHRRKQSTSMLRRHDAISVSQMDPRDIQESFLASMEADEEDEEE